MQLRAFFGIIFKLVHHHRPLLRLVLLNHHQMHCHWFELSHVSLMNLDGTMMISPLDQRHV